MGWSELDLRSLRSLRSRRWGRRLFAGVLVLLGAGLAAELAVRLVAPQPLTWLNVYVTDRELPWALAPGETQLGIGDGWDVYTDSRGFRSGPTRDTVDVDRPYLLAVGDSFAFGHGVDRGEGFVAQIEERLSGIPIRNAAVPGYGPIEYREVVRHHVETTGLAGVLLFSFLGNDFQDCRPRRLEVWDGVLTSGSRPVRYWLKTNSHLYRFVSAKLEATREARIPASQECLFHPEAWGRPPLSEWQQAFARAFADIAFLCEERGVPLFVALLPPYDDGRAGARTAFDAGFRDRHSSSCEWDLPIRRAAAILDGLGILHADASCALERLTGPVYLAGNGHYTVEANAAIAEWVAACVPRFFPR